MLPPFFEGIISWSGYRCNPCFPHGVEKNCPVCGKVPLEGPAVRRGLVARQGAESLRGAPARRGCGSPPRGQKPFLFLRKKKRFLTPKKKMGPVYGGFLVVHGGLRLYTLFGDQPRPLHAIGEQREDYGSILRPPGCTTLVAECGGSLGASRTTQVSRSAAEEALNYPGPERGTRRRRVGRTADFSLFHKGRP